ncbi:hypothetical protein SAMN05216382_2688 [Sphingomonas palmae]|uniref:Uncharacterized protein n=1 Tax=Sphingomonas palmae TaxID=1855283 RepID=A0A1H7T7W3_9SPHN|nr:hypothetical protein [Sphingomonas palmae]SEL80609.1 hypothetical protein SAMN05216382_2688 [Sphingomonas palmae]
MSRLSPSEQMLADLAAAGIDEEALLAETRPEPWHAADGTLVLDSFGDERLPLDLEVVFLRDVPNIRSAFGAYLAFRARQVKAISIIPEFVALGKFIDFLVDRKLALIRPRDITDQLLDAYRDWLNDYEKPLTGKGRDEHAAVFSSVGGGKLGVETKRVCMHHLLEALRMLRVDSRWFLEIRRDLDLVRGGDWATSGSRRTPVTILTRPRLKLLVRLCREEVVEVSKRLRDAWDVIDGKDTADRQTIVDRELILEVGRIHTRFQGKPPLRKKLASALGEDLAQFPRLRALKSSQYNAALSILYPSGRLLMPFMLLFGIYYRYNRSIVTTLKESHFSEQPSAHGKRLRGLPFKNRAGKTQYASWPITDDYHNPSKMIELLLLWTSRIRSEAATGEQNHLFLERCFGARTRSLASKDGFNRALVRFLKDHEETLKVRFTFRSLRPTVINLVHHLFDGDLVATAEAGQHNPQVMIDHYLSDGARRINDEALVPAMHLRDQWWRSHGIIDGRADKRRGDVSAATPGFRCEDPYDSRVPGQRPGDPCTAYGMCAVCPLGKVDISSPDAFALVVKFREALLRSRSRMPQESWIARWAPVLDRIETYTLRLFPEQVKAGAVLDIPPLPTVE